MRCLNCHTVMMDTDLECPSCHASVENATAAPPETAPSPSGMLMMLPMFGGALGGLAYAALAGSQTTVIRGASRGVSSTAYSPFRWMFGILAALLGMLLLVLAFVQGLSTWRVVQRPAKVMEAADLVRIKDFKSAPPWIEFTFQESKRLSLTVKRTRMGNAGAVDAQGLLVRVEDRWMAVSVAAGFEGTRLVGRLIPSELPASQSLVEAAQKRDPQMSLLPFEFNAVEGSVSDQRTRYFASGFLALLGFGGLWLSMSLCSARRVPVATDPAMPTPSIRAALPPAPGKRRR